MVCWTEPDPPIRAAEPMTHAPTPSTTDEPAIEARDVARAYGKGESVVRALRGVDLAVGRGERVALLGKSGSGKSTLLNLLGGLDRPTGGTIRVAGRDLHALGARALARYRLETVGMIFQAYNLVESRTALENVELPMVFAGRPRAERRAQAREALAAVGLAGRLGHHPSQLSGGERQRVAIARALVNRPEVLLADEPTGNLDSATAREVLGLLLGHLDRHGTTLVLVTHDEELARVASDRVVTLRDGSVAVGEVP
jgi:ABC-type lipoprotein export system ATPase subunit